MNPDRGSLVARRYLLGEASEEECTAIERTYFGDEAAGDEVAAAEEDLIQDYLSNRLTAEERRLFDRHYLASPRHRTRVEVIRRLSATGEGHGFRPDVSVIGKASRKWSHYDASSWLAVAAAVVLAVGAIWTFIPRHQGDQVHSQTQPAPASTLPERTVVGPASGNQTSPSTPAQQLFAFTLTPASVRSANDVPSLVIPAAADLVALQLEGDVGRASIANPSVVIRTVTGSEVWRGKATVPVGSPLAVIARVDVPARQLPADDYVVVLHANDARGVDKEPYTYFLRVRSR